MCKLRALFILRPVEIFAGWTVIIPMRWMLLLWGLLLSVLLAPLCSAEEFVQRTFTLKDGLGSYNINDISEDSQGFMWLATQEGLYRVSNGVLQRVDRQQGVSLIDEQYLQFARPLANGNVFVSSQYQTYLYQIEHNRFIPFSSAEHFPDYQHSSVFKIAQDKQKTLYFLTENGTVWRLSNDGSKLDLLFHLPEKPVFYWNQLLFVNGQLLIGSSSELALYDLQGKQLQLINWRAEQDWLATVAQDARGNIWLGGGRGLYRYQPSTGKVVHMAGVSELVSHITDGKDGNLWLIADGHLLKYNPNVATVEHFSAELRQQAGIDSLSVMMRDRHDLLWVSGPSFPLAVAAEPPSFIEQNIEIKGHEAVSPQVVWSFYQHGGVLYLGGDGVLNHYDIKQKTTQVAEFTTLKNGQSIFTIKPLDANHLLLGTALGLKVVEISSFKEVPISPWFKKDNPLNGQLIFQIFVEQDQWWFSSSAGLFRWQPGTPQLTHIALPESDEMVSPAVNSVMRDSQQRLWISADASFGYLLDGQYVSMEQPLVELLHKAPIATQVMEVSKALYWVATRENGVLLFDAKAGKAVMRSDDWRVDCQTVYFLSHTDNFWLAGCTDKIIRMNRYTGKVEAFGRNDGLIASELIEQSYLYDEQLGLFVGTPVGAMVLNVPQMHKRINELSVKLESVRMQYNSQKVELQLQPTLPLLVKPGVKLVSFQLANFDYLNPTSFSFKYRIRPFNSRTPSPYLLIENQNQINILGLDSGKYQLEVLSKNNSRWDESPLVLPFEVQLYWWESRWFRLLLLLLVIGSLVAVIVYRQRQVARFQRINRELSLSDERLRQSLAGSKSDLWEWSAFDGFFVLHNYSNVLQSNQRLIKVSDQDLPLSSEDMLRFQREWQAMLEGVADSIDSEVRYQRRNGNWGWIRVQGRPIRRNDISGKVVKVAGIYSELSQQRALETEANLFALAFENTTEGMLILDEFERITLSNLAAEELLGIASHQLIGMPIAQLLDVSSADITPINQLLEQSKTWNGDVVLLRNHYYEFSARLNISTMANLQAYQRYYVLVFADISEQKQAEEKLQRLANYDNLTGQPNRSYFDRCLNEAVATATEQQQKLALLFFDLDKFKQVNDYYGHNMGDALLVEASRRLQKALGSGNVLSRFGGDEFVALVHSGDSNQLDELCQTLLNELSSPFLLLGRELAISSSIGISIWPDDTTDVDTWLKFADQAMYEAKQAGRGTFRYYSKALSAERLFELQLERHLHKARFFNELQMYYQPLFDTTQQRIIALEALLTWHHRQYGEISAEQLQRTADSAGLIVELDCWALTQACQQAQQWSERLGRPISICINISPLHFRQAHFVATVEDILRSSGLPPTQLVIEISENVLVKEIETSVKHLIELEEMGINLTIDDFGTGYSPLVYLRQFQVHSLKISRSFLPELEHSVGDQAIVSGCIALAQSLNMTVVADGVASATQMTLLQQRGCVIMQGDYFCAPLSVVEMTKQLQSHS